ncbi:hypothetical protein MKZ38_007002 [Zalerion maritima]|uniref:Uncharacterized protein n=1 Tax=Zalerion maritima TaxID=339359 RepID=A0AAD5WN62_9PEZI|nr:hypothetical protein MKZ38_007002 [Zalerion maritima]
MMIWEDRTSNELASRKSTWLLDIMTRRKDRSPIQQPRLRVFPIRLAMSDEMDIFLPGSFAHTTHRISLDVFNLIIGLAVVHMNHRPITSPVPLRSRLRLLPDLREWEWWVCEAVGQQAYAWNTTNTLPTEGAMDLSLPLKDPLLAVSLQSPISIGTEEMSKPNRTRLLNCSTLLQYSTTVANYCKPPGRMSSST